MWRIVQLGTLVALESGKLLGSRAARCRATAPFPPHLSRVMRLRALKVQGNFFSSVIFVRCAHFRPFGLDRSLRSASQAGTRWRKAHFPRV